MEPINSLRDRVGVFIARWSPWNLQRLLADARGQISEMGRVSVVRRENLRRACDEIENQKAVIEDLRKAVRRRPFDIASITTAEYEPCLQARRVVVDVPMTCFLLRDDALFESPELARMVVEESAKKIAERVRAQVIVTLAKALRSAR